MLIYCLKFKKKSINLSKPSVKNLFENTFFPQHFCNILRGTKFRDVTRNGFGSICLSFFASRVWQHGSFCCGIRSPLGGWPIYTRWNRHFFPLVSIVDNEGGCSGKDVCVEIGGEVRYAKTGKVFAVDWAKCRNLRVLSVLRVMDDQIWSDFCSVYTFCNNEWNNIKIKTMRIFPLNYEFCSASQFENKT